MRPRIALSALFSLLLMGTADALALTLQEALSLAREANPQHRASFLRVRSAEDLHSATLGPYLPSLDATASFRRLSTSSNDFTTKVYDLTLSYTLLDGGQRQADRRIAYFTLESEKAVLNQTLRDLELSVKSAFYTLIAQRETLEQRKIQLRDAQKDHEVAEGRYTYGVAKLSDVLQASVRLEQARFNVVQAEGDLQKAYSDLSSLIGRPLDSRYDTEGPLDVGTSVPPAEAVSGAALRRPEIVQAEQSLKISEQNRLLARSAFLPVFSASASYTKTSGGYSSITFPEEKTLGLTATWNLFELGKFFTYRSSKTAEETSAASLEETKRQILLEASKTYEDFRTSLNKLRVAEQQLRQAEHNYNQAFGEYKVGKADILSLVQAESLLSTAREQLIASKLNLALSRALLERVAGVERLESLIR